MKMKQNSTTNYKTIVLYINVLDSEKKYIQKSAV